MADWNHVDTLWMPPMRTSLLAVLCLAAVHEASCWLPTPRLLPARPCVPLSRHAVSPRLDEAKGVDALITELRGSVRASTLSAFIPCASSRVARAASLSPLHRMCTWRAQTPDQLPKLLADNLKSIDQRLFLRLAEMSDEETDDYEKLRIRQLATLVASTLETILEQADRQMSEDAEVVQGLLRSLSLESGEFELPIAPAQLSACRSAIRESLPKLDEGFVGTVKAYMRKASDDGLESMVDVLRVLLQTFASERLRSLAADGVGMSDGVKSALIAVLDVSAPRARHRSYMPRATRAAMLMRPLRGVCWYEQAPPNEWDSVLDEQLNGDAAECNVEELVDTLQDKMGEVVLGMPAVRRSPAALRIAPVPSVPLCSSPLVDLLACGAGIGGAVSHR